MRRIMGSRPSPAIVVAILALVAGVTGVAIAQPVAKKPVTKKKAKKIADKEINKLAPGLSVANADTAGSAGSADSATNSSQLGGLGAGSYQKRVRWAFVNGATIGAQSGGITAEANTGVGCTTGCYYLDFGSSQAGKAIVATPSATVAGVDNTVVTALCGGTGNPGGFACTAPGTNDTSHIFVQTANAAGSPRNRAFYVAVIG
jgi:hypothetical protein